jgi:MoaA/NifB/PqqE/SkfB family radical SAM enzyme
MISKEILKATRVFRTLTQRDSPKLVLMEGPVNCNRSCDYCVVPKRWDKEKTSTVAQTCKQIDWAINEGFNVLNYVGGETLAQCPRKGDIISERRSMCPGGLMVSDSIVRQKEEPFRTKEGITFKEQTERVLKHASKNGMITNITTNGDFVDFPTIAGLKRSGLDSLSLSLHSLNDSSIAHVISTARMAAKEKIVPIVNVVFTKDRTDDISKIAETCMANGILFSTAVVQERGGGFSSIPQDSQIPTSEQQEEVFKKLIELKKKGFVRDNINYLKNATSFKNNSWKCNPKTDSFVHVRNIEEGKAGVCSETALRFPVNTLHLKDGEWRKSKKDLIDKCPGCTYTCYYESENPSLKGDFRTFLNYLLIKSGQAGLVKLMGKMSLGNKMSEIKSIPQSKEEIFQKEYKREHKSLFGKAKRMTSTLAHYGLGITFMAAFIGYALISSVKIRKHHR